MGIFSNLKMPGEIISKGIDAVRDTVDDMHTSDEERKKLEQEMTKIENEMTKEINKTYRKELEEKGSIIEAEAKSEHFLTSNWRPILMLIFGFIVLNNYVLVPYMELMFDVSVNLEIPPDMWAILKLGIGGYIAGKSGEVITGRLSPNHDSSKEDYR